MLNTKSDQAFPSLLVPRGAPRDPKKTIFRWNFVMNTTLCIYTQKSTTFKKKKKKKKKKHFPF